MNTALADKRIVITGITGGIARATAKRLLDQGAEVIVSARSTAKLEAALAELEGKISGHVMDLQDQQSIEAFFAKTGRIDHLVTPAASSSISPLGEIDLDGSRRLLETKQWGQLLCVRAALPHLNQNGSITLFSGTVSQKPFPGSTMFAAVGAATEAMARVWALELAPIRVNTVVPGVIDTEIWNELLGDAEAAQAQLKAIGDSLPVQRVGTADDVAKAAAFVIDNGYVNGISLVVDGGHRVI